MFGFERKRIEEMIKQKNKGDQVGASMHWDPRTKRISCGDSRDPDRPVLEVTQSDLGHA